MAEIMGDAHIIQEDRGKMQMLDYLKVPVKNCQSQRAAADQ